MKKPSFTCVDLFCGAGGLSLGLKRAGFVTELALDLDPAAGATYASNFPDVRFVNEDIRTIRWTALRGAIDLVAGGPPCQPFSVAGDQMAAADSRDMLPEFVRAVKEIKPRAFLLENVAGLVSKRHTSYFELKMAKLQDLGYEIDYQVLNAADFGVPQERRRVIAIGIRDEAPEFPCATHGPNTKRDYVPAREILAGDPPDELNRAIVTYAKQPVLRRSPFAGMLVNGGGRPIELARPSMTIPASAGGNRTHIIDPSGVLVAYHRHLMKGGTPRSGIVKGVRRLTVRESARLQDFPDSFQFSGERSAQYRQVGNAVPPALAWAVGRAIFEKLC
jgi:DNA (cytosine-5)-methyltransferase 1